MDTQNTSQKPLVSFILTYYNLPISYLKECLNSLLLLSLHPNDREIILIDDGSNISPITELEEYKSEIIYIRQRNKGLSEARNTGIRIATGKYIQFIDADDYLIPAVYEHCLDIARYYNPDVVLFKDTNNKAEILNTDIIGPMSGAEYMLKNNLHAAACHYIFNKNFLIDLGFTPGLLNEDEEFTPRLFLRADRLFVTNAHAYYYRMRRDSLSHNPNKEHRLNKLKDLERILIKLQKDSFTLPKMERKALERRIAQLTMDFLYNTIKYTHSPKRLSETIERLTRQSLYPLPSKKYTLKYHLFRKAIQLKVGRLLLFMIIK